MPTLTRGRMAQVRACTLKDYLALARPGFPHLPPAMLEKIGDGLVRGDPAFTCATWNGEVLVCAGITIGPWPGLATAWALLSPEGRRRPVITHRVVARFLDGLILAHGLRRIEARVFAEDPGARRWIERLGFKAEGLCPFWGPGGETGAYYARVMLPPISGGTGVETAAIIGAVAAVAGTAVATTGVIMNAQQQKKAYAYQGAVADQQVELAERAGAAAEADTRDRARRVMAAQRNALGEGGITQEGTPLLVLMDTAQQAELDALRARYSGQVAAQGPAVAADLARQKADYATTAGLFGAGSTLLTGATSVAGIYASGRRRSPNSPVNTTGSESGYYAPGAPSR